MTADDWTAMPWDRLLALLEEDLATRGNSPRSMGQDLPAERPVQNELAWEELSRRVRAIANAVVAKRFHLSQETAEDIMQEIHLRMQEAAWVRRLASRTAPEAYLAVVVRHAAVSVLRRQQSERVAKESLRQERTLPDRQEDLGSGRELIDVLERQLSYLTPEEHELLHLRFWQALPMAQIGEKLGISTSAATVRIFRLLHKLRERLSKPTSR